MRIGKSDIAAGIGTALIMVLLFLFLLYCGFSARIPDEEEGLTVNFGNIDVSAGRFEPQGQTSDTEQQAIPKPESVPVKSELAEESLITDQEESIALEEAKRKAEEEAKRQEEERIRKEKERKAAETKNLAANVFGSARTQGESHQGSEETPQANQGSPQGSHQEASTVNAGSGYGDFSLDGRSAMGSLPRPHYDIQSEGVVVVRIIVSSNGSVIAANIDLQGTDTDNTPCGMRL